MTDLDRKLPQALENVTPAGIFVIQHTRQPGPPAGGDDEFRGGLAAGTAAGLG